MSEPVALCLIALAYAAAGFITAAKAKAEPEATYGGPLAMPYAHLSFLLGLTAVVIALGALWALA